MDFVYLQILTAVGVFLSLISFSYLPYCIIQFRARRRSTLSASRRKTPPSTVPVLSLCNCFAAGVFLATCFLGMVPHVREHVAEWNLSQRKDSEIINQSTPSSTTANGGHGSHGESKHATPWTEILLMGGFLMILLIEELINVCQRVCRCCRRRQTNQGHHHHHHGPIERVRPRPLASAENEPLMSDGETGSGLQISLGNDIKSAPDSPVDLLRMSELDGQLRIRESNSSNHGGGHHHHVDAGLLLTEGSRSLSWRSVALLLGLGIHGVFEGVALGLQDTPQSLYSLLFGVMSHEVLCAVAFGINLASHRASAGVAFLTTVVFSLTIPIGMVAGFVVSRRKTEAGGGEIIRIALEGLAAGTFVYVAFMDMLAHELAHGHDEAGHESTSAKWRLPKVLCVCFGFLLFLGLTFVS